MNLAFKVFTALIFLFLPSIIHAETSGCENFNTDQFFEPKDDETLILSDEELFFHCLGYNNGSLIWAKDGNGSIPLFKAVVGEIHPDYISDFFYAVDDWDKLLDKRDNQGRNAMTVAIQEAPYWEQLLTIISFGGDIFQKQSDDSPEFIDLAAKIKGNEDFVALLLALGAVSFLEKNDLKDPDNTNMRALVFNKDWNNSVTSEEFDACEKIDKKEILETLSGGQIKFCFETASHNLKISQLDRQGNSYLHKIAKYGKDPDLIDAIFESASEEQKENFLRQTNEDGHTALDFAAKYSTEPNIITRLLARGMQPQQASGSWNPFKKDFITQPLHLAASRTDDFAGVMMLRLLAAGADVFLQDEDGNTALHIYMKNKNAWVLDVRLLLEVQNWQASIFRLKALELKNKKNDTVLGLATQKINDLLIMQEMLFYEADPDHVDQEGWTPLLIYTFKGENPDVFQLLLEDSEEVCDIQVSKGKSKGATVIMLLKNNEKLYNLDNFDGSSPMALLKEKCPA